MKTAALLALTLALAATAQADDGQPMRDENGLAFDEPKAGDIVGFDEENQEAIILGGQEAGPEVYRGTKSVAGEFPTSGWIGNCTANVVAPNVVFTAGHCKGTGARISFQHRQSGQSYPATCTRHPRYNTRTTYNDWTLCKLDSPLPAGTKMLTFKIDAAPAIQTDTYVNGFGAPNVGVHYWGNAKISSTSGDQDLVTCGPANLGGGDSGGSLIEMTGDRTLVDGAFIYGVNSRGNNSCSWYNRVSHDEFVTWAREYELAAGVKLCGVSGAADICKGGNPNPPDPTPPDCGAELADVLGKEAALKASLDGLKACMEAR